MARVTNISVIPDTTQSIVEGLKRRQKKLKTWEKLLIAATIIFAFCFILFLVLFIMAEKYYYQLAREKNICTSKECIESSMMLRQTVDLTQDPCEDFYEYACGKFKDDHPVPEVFLSNSWFTEKENRLNRLILDILRRPVSDTDLKSVRETKEFYQSCVNTTELDSIGLKPLYDALQLLGLPKVVPNNNTVENFNLARTLALAQRFLSLDILFSISISKGITNGTIETTNKSTILQLAPPGDELGISDRSDYKVLSGEKFLGFRRKTDRDNKLPSENQKSPQKIIQATIEFISSIIEEISLDLKENLGVEQNSSNYKTTAFKIITFALGLVKDSINNTDNITDLNNNTDQITFSLLQDIMNAESKTDLDSNRIDWREFISILFEKVNNTYNVETEPIIVVDKEYFKYLSRVLSESEPETIQRYIWWKVVANLAGHTTTDIRDIYIKYFQDINGEKLPLTRVQICTQSMKHFMNIALAHEMSKNENFSTTSQKVREMLKNIQKIFENTIKSLSWMDSKTKAITLDKAKSISQKIGYADGVIDSDKTNKYYESLNLVKSDYLMNMVRISEWEVQKILQTIGLNKDISTENLDVLGNPLQVNAYYSREDNAIVIPAGILQTPFYFRGLESLNYGAIGTILGHELTHGFDIEGKNYNKFGERQDDWWPSAITAEYESRAKCFIDQYENFTMNDTNKLNGAFTLAENIADNGGIRESYKAYQLYKFRHGEEPKLPGFENFSHDQLLFLSFANIWCETAGPKFHFPTEDSHSPPRIRVLASLQNMKEFSDVFNCSEKSFMNPHNKCIIW